ncbi:unnamed protein product, partial [marine sediment metagenome]
MDKYFSEREKGFRSRVNNEINKNAWGGIYALIESKIDDGSFGKSFPDICPDGGIICGSNIRTFISRLKAEIPDITWNSILEMPNTYTILDLIEFCFKNIAKPIKIGYHGYHKHNHYDFDVEEGQSDFQDDI